MCAVHPTQPNPIQEFLRSLHLAPRQFHKALTVWPLVRPGEASDTVEARYVSLAEALEHDWVVVEEVSKGGSVPNIRVVNRGDVAVLVLFGEELIGAKQNRVANASFLVPAASKLVIDVSCVEQGRWSVGHETRFMGAESILSSELRRKIHWKVSAARRLGRGFTSDQGEVWDEVADRVRYSGARSPTASYQDYVGTRSSEREEIVRSFEAVPGQVGFVAAIGEQIAGLEAIGDPRVFARLFPTLLRSYAIDAVDSGWLCSRPDSDRGAQRFDAPEPFLAALTVAPFQRSRSLGLGHDLRIEGNGVAGCALEAGEIVHLTAFPHELTEREGVFRRWVRRSPR